MTTFPFILYIIIGLIAITLIDTIGSVASRKMNFKYTYLSILSLATYVSIAFVASKDYSLNIVLLTTALLGLYDGTVGLWFSFILKANTGESSEETTEMPGTKSAIVMIVLALIFGLIGFGLSRI